MRSDPYKDTETTLPLEYGTVRVVKSRQTFANYIFTLASRLSSGRARREANQEVNIASRTDEDENGNAKSRYSSPYLFKGVRTVDEN